MDTIPLQRQYLFPAQPGIETNHHKYIRRQIFDRIQQLLGLCVGQSFFFFLRNASLGIEILGRIVLDQITILGRVGMSRNTVLFNTVFSGQLHCSKQGLERYFRPDACMLGIPKPFESHFV